MASTTRLRRLLAPLTSFRLHPLDPLTPDEIAAVSLPVRHHIASKTDISAIKSNTTYPLPSLKKVLLAYLGIPLTPGGQPEAPIPITRKAKVDFLDVDAYNVILALDGGKWGIESLKKLLEGTQPKILFKNSLRAKRL